MRTAITRTTAVTATAITATALAACGPLAKPVAVTMPLARPISAATTSPTPTLAPPLTEPGVYMSVRNKDKRTYYRLAPGATTWTKVPISEPVPVAGRSEHTISPNRSLMVTVAEGKVIVSGLDGRNPRIVATAPRGQRVCTTQWSGDSKRLLIGMTDKADRTNRASVYTMAADGTDRHKIDGADAISACWARMSVDGTTIVFTPSLRSGLSVREYDEVKVSTDGETHGVVLNIPSDMNLGGIVEAVSPDGRYAMIAATKVRPDGSFRPMPDHWFIADLRTGAAYPLPLSQPTRMWGRSIFDASGHLLITVNAGGKGEIRTYDVAGHYLTTLPTVPAGTSYNSIEALIV